MTRRANHWQNDIIAKIVKPARRNPSRAFSLKFPNRTAAAQHDATSPNARRPGVVGMPSSEPSFAHTIGRRARTRRLAARIVTAARGPQRDKVRAPNDLRLHRDHAAHFCFLEKLMTAYLISLALIGLVFIAVSEEFS